MLRGGHITFCGEGDVSHVRGRRVCHMVRRADTAYGREEVSLVTEGWTCHRSPGRRGVTGYGEEASHMLRSPDVTHVKGERRSHMLAGRGGVTCDGGAELSHLSDSGRLNLKNL